MEPIFSVGLLIVMEFWVLAELKVATSVFVTPEVDPGYAPAPVLQLVSVLTVTQLASVGVALHVADAAKRVLEEPRTSDARSVAIDAPRKEGRLDALRNVFLGCAFSMGFFACVFIDKIR